MSLGELFFNKQLVEMDMEDCKQAVYVDCFSSRDGRPFFKGHMKVGVRLISVLVLVDWGATSSFIDKSFVELNRLKTEQLSQGVSVRSFDG